MSNRLLLLAALAAPALASPALAQRRHPPQPWERRSAPSLSLGGDAVYSTVGAHARDARVGDGVGFDAHVGIGVSALALGVGYQRTEHDFAGAASRATYQTVYVEPRVLLDLGAGNFTPYVAARVGRTRVALPAVAAATAGRTTASSYALGGGVQVWLARALALDLGALWSRTEYGHGGSATDILRDGENGATFRAGVRLTP